MEFMFTPELKSFREEIRDFIKQNLPQSAAGSSFGRRGGDFATTRKFQRALAERNWLTLAWPKEYGGVGASLWQQLVMNEEMAYQGAPGAGANMGVNWVGPALMLYGSDEQKNEHVPKIASGETWWCTLYSEPAAGSDLASLQTRAIRDGDDYVINGQKIWTSGGHNADWGWMATRTDTDAPKHKGISMLLVDMKTSGITIRPLPDMTGAHNFNEVFFEDVRVPIKNRVGEENRGWYYMAVALDFERSGIGSYAGGRRSMEHLLALTKSRPEFLQRNPGVRYELADRFTELTLGTYLAYRITYLQSQEIVANYEASVSKVFGSELGQRTARTALHLLGLYGMLGPGNGDLAPVNGALATGYVGSPGGTIAAGTSEIQRNIIATRGLGLPRE